ncbi:Phosphate:acyl-ACP acyltransferase PlsX [Sulfitobacter noctilucicola]|uniref:Phosphate acyltransferase n=1 Tax=Sulfitobacter noctilucicola TaxID=1342301 RepID=A0A7W6M7S5_9RHOB|nr:phosphate acyltransferase PlsX [Sulfitobacter noctilucicola]KIN64841.1 Phosphate:acyl-ACP acyltransferase PlsX [Sulfitobacter noctilucicola]MBB4174015.1 glycerol-3-phosphate acyltransferase PlsX [Sulfitobacter noctilucicola]
MTAPTDHTDALAPARTKARTLISVDAMGGDKGPAAVVAGCSLSARINPDIAFVLHGDSEQLTPLIAKYAELQGRCDVRHAADVVTMDDKPSQVVRTGKDTSMWSAIESVRTGDAAVAVSCGNTGALMALSMIRLRKLPGVNRPAIAVLYPAATAQGFNVMLDVGADIKADADDLMRFALMGVSYARNGMDIAKPRVGLLNVGTEEHKGRAELKEAYDLIRDHASDAGYAFVGFVEGGDISGDTADVIVTDGFTGNVAIKTGEGTASLIGARLREAFSYSILSRISSVLAYRSLMRLQQKIDPRRVNGGVFLGLNGTVVKSHGSADATGISAAIKLAAQLSANQFNDKLAARVAAALPAEGAAE